MRYIFLILIFIFSCTSKPEAYISHIKGYWEIDKVTLQNGNHKQYSFNGTIDYFELNDSLIGYRKKLKPNFSGSFETSKDIENIKIIHENDSLHIYYSTSYSNWKETILLATKDQLKIINQNKDVYLYKRYQPLILD